MTGYLTQLTGAKTENLLSLRPDQLNSNFISCVVMDIHWLIDKISETMGGRSSRVTNIFITILFTYSGYLVV